MAYPTDFPMVRTFRMLLLIIAFGNCKKDLPMHITYQKGDFWVSDFRNNSFPSKAFSGDKIYCSSLETDAPNYFYCLDLKTGKVDWVKPVKSWAAQPPVIGDDFIYYCGYLGDIYKLDKNGNEIWYTKLNDSYGGHVIDPTSKDLLVDAVATGYIKISFETGEQTTQISNTQVHAQPPVIAGDTVYQLVNDSLFCTKSTTHTTLWKIKCDVGVDRVFLIKGSVFYFDNMKYLHSLNAHTGTLQWRSDKSFPRPEVNPHVELEQEKLLCYFSNLNDARLINTETGKVERILTYEQLQQYLRPLKQYLVSNEKHNYEITIKNAFGGAGSFRDQFDVFIEQKD